MGRLNLKQDQLRYRLGGNSIYVMVHMNKENFNCLLVWFRPVFLFLTILVTSYSCGKDECNEDGDNLQKDDTGVFECKKNPSKYGAPATNIKRFKHVQCDLDGYSVSIDDNNVRCTNSQNDLFLGGDGTDNQLIFCPSNQKGKWIKITGELFSEIFYFQCNEDNFAHLYFLLQIIENNEPSEVYIKCTNGQQGVMSEDRTNFACE